MAGGGLQYPGLHLLKGLSTCWHPQVAEWWLAPRCSTSLLCHLRSHETGTTGEQGHVGQLCQLHGTMNQESGGSAANI